MVDAEGYVHVNRIRYSAPYALIDRPLEVRETMERVDLYDGPRKVATHPRVLGPVDIRVTDPAHRPPRGQGRAKQEPWPEETALLLAEPQLATYLAGLKKQSGGRRAFVRRLLSLLHDYPREAFLTAVTQAEHYGLFDLERLERMVLKQIASDYFVLPVHRSKMEDEDA